MDILFNEEGRPLIKNDITIIGGGIGGLMAAYRLIENDPSLTIEIFDKGLPLEERYCRAAHGGTCVHCKNCSITNGFAGAGAFSDGKFNLGTAYGGTLSEELGEDLTMHYIKEVDKIISSFTPSNALIEFFDTDNSLKLKCLQNNLRLLDMKTKHLGTENNYKIMENLICYLKQKNVIFHPLTTVTDVFPKDQDNYYKLLVSSSSNPEFSTPVYAKNVIVATGRGGSDLVQKICDSFSIETESNKVDIGVRVEMKDAIWQEFSSKIYEPKILYKTKTFEDDCRMFCFNQGGLVSAENTNGIITANGHSFADPSKKTDNCNFAILSSIKFTEPFNKPTEYVKSYSKMANIIGDNNVLIQRFGDLIRGRRTTDSRLSKNTVIPTLKATPGDISLVLPHRILTNIIETLYALDKVAPGTANDDTLLYGCESKYYSLKPKHNTDFSIADNLYLIGDGSGICRGLSQSGAMGIYVADKITSKESRNQNNGPDNL